MYPTERKQGVNVSPESATPVDPMIVPGEERSEGPRGEIDRKVFTGSGREGSSVFPRQASPGKQRPFRLALDREVCLLRAVCQCLPIWM